MATVHFGPAARRVSQAGQQHQPGRHQGEQAGCAGVPASAVSPRLDRDLLDDVVVVGFGPGDAAGHEVKDVAVAYPLSGQGRGTGEPGPVRSTQRPPARWCTGRPRIGTDLAGAAQDLGQDLRERYLVRHGQVEPAPRAHEW